MTTSTSFPRCAVLACPPAVSTPPLTRCCCGTWWRQLTLKDPESVVVEAVEEVRFWRASQIAGADLARASLTAEDLTEDEIGQLRQAFATADPDDTGVITGADLPTALGVLVSAVRTCARCSSVVIPHARLIHPPGHCTDGGGHGCAARGHERGLGLVHFVRRLRELHGQVERVAASGVRACLHRIITFCRIRDHVCQSSELPRSHPCQSWRPHTAKSSQTTPHVALPREPLAALPPSLRPHTYFGLQPLPSPRRPHHRSPCLTNPSPLPFRCRLWMKPPGSPSAKSCWRRRSN